LRRGSFVYWPAYWPHTIRNASRSPVTYAMLKWQAAPLETERPLQPRTFHIEQPHDSSAAPVAMRTMFESPTGMLNKLHCHVTEMQPGAGYPAHADEHDVAIFVFEGSVKTLGETVSENGLIYYAAGELHGMRNAGDEPARYLVFEFHGASGAHDPSP
jgi:redox-sensitive bicupin YhaK (pirin superfamily)